jgi:hypothetical protein
MAQTMNGHLARYFDRWWLPALVQLCLVGGFAATAAVGWCPLLVVTDVLFVLAGLAFLAVLAACIWNLDKIILAVGINRQKPGAGARYIPTLERIYHTVPPSTAKESVQGFGPSHVNPT